MNQIITRFGPSPTGFLHIGAVRTALFAYLFAKANNGKFILRIEDTDQARFVKGAVEDIQSALQWLGIAWDTGPVFQSQRLQLYKKYADQLLQEGHAYHCTCTKERLDKLREEQQKNKHKVGYDGHCRDKKLVGGGQGVVRFKIPESGQTRFTDAIRGEIVFENNQMDDLVILKADGYPTYHLAHVVDDHDMLVTHVHRGEEWIPSTPKHMLMFQAFGWSPPQYVHLPVILSQGGGKLSKRKGSVFVNEFKKMGYLPEAMVNFMVLLGWGYSETEELYTLDELKKIFKHENINKASPVFSDEKLNHFNGLYIRKKSKEELADLCLPYLNAAGIKADKAYLVQVVALFHERLVLLSEIVEKAAFFFADDLAYPDPKLLVQGKSTAAETKQFLQAVQVALSQLKDFSVAALDKTLREGAEKLGITPGQLFMPVRVAVSASTTTPGLFEMLSVLGKIKVQKRLDAAITLLENLSFKPTSQD